ncbi:hypothetical protein NA56DRAFT_296557 [Hyaloscypha hepaticicola]|uniref:Uncharacterized protein n=1 Tax=Hyaloscypha hepaticicola TaxID=2082293 RepID=A0A2J6QKL5_9HELO|nr:hypothetical protein NA56DRAFT_296557 [Hyaloscypha hepaticicola]
MMSTLRGTQGQGTLVPTVVRSCMRSRDGPFSTNLPGLIPSFLLPFISLIAIFSSFILQQYSSQLDYNPRVSQMCSWKSHGGPFKSPHI